jgi:hypothetical protein
MAGKLRAGRISFKESSGEHAPNHREHLSGFPGSASRYLNDYRLVAASITVSDNETSAWPLLMLSTV